jgi:hypothetical protein
VKRPDLSTVEALQADFALQGELVGHDHADVVCHAVRVSEIQDDLEAGLVAGTPANFLLAEVELSGWRRLLRRRRG